MLQESVVGKNVFGLNNITKIFANQFVQTSLGCGRSKEIKFNISRKYVVAYKNVAHTPLDVGKLPYISMSHTSPGFSGR